MKKQTIILLGDGQSNLDCPDTEGDSVDLSFVTATEDRILEGFVGADREGNPVNGTIETVTPSLTGNKFTVGKGFVPENKELTVPEAPSPTVSGNTVTIHAGYVPTEQTVETESGSMEIYKCVDADGLTWWIVSGCGSTEANGRYYEGDEIQNDYGTTAKTYYQKDGSCSLRYPMDYWVLQSGSTVLYRDESWNYYDGDPSQCTSWVTDSGVEPVPTIAKETTTGNGWKGNLYDPETQTVSDEVTKLTYLYSTPKIGKFYTADAMVECGVLATNDYIYRSSMQSIEDFSYHGTEPTFGAFQGVPCMIFDGNGAFYKTLSTPLNSKFTISVFYYGTNSCARVASIGKWARNACVEFFINGVYTYPDSTGNGLTDATYWDRWHTVTATYNGSHLKVYTDGVLAKTYYVTMNTISPIVCLGSNLTSGGIPGRDSYMYGYIGDYTIWNRAITDREIMYNHKRMMALVTA